MAAKISGAQIEDMLKEMKMTKEETDKLTDAFSKPEFRKFFAEYMDEISDPKALEETNRYLQEIEERGKAEEMYGAGAQLIIPEPGFVVKTREAKPTSGRKCFINVCTSDKVAVASASKETPGMWQIPHSLGPMSEDKDKGGEPCTLHDFVVHPDTLRMMDSNGRFKKMVIETAMEMVEKARGLSLSPEFTEPKMKYKGQNGAKIPKAQMHRTKAAGDGPTPSDAGAAAGRVPPVNPGAAFSDVLPSDKLRSANPPPPRPRDEPGSGAGARSGFSFDSSGGKKAGAGKPPAPTYRVIERGELDLSEAWGDMGRNLAAVPRRPRELVVVFSLPGAVSDVKEWDMEEGEAELRLEVPGYYSVTVPLRYPVLPDKGRAKWHKDRKELEVAMPVRQPTREEIAALLPRALAPAAAQPALVTEIEAEAAPASSSQEEGSDADVSAPAAPASSEPASDSGSGAAAEPGPSESEAVRRWREVHQRRDTEEKASVGDTDPLVGPAEAAPAPVPAPPAQTPSAPAAPAPAPQPQPEPQPSEDGSFFPAAAFEGARAGFAFKLGPRGVGYYRDSGAAVAEDLREAKRVSEVVAASSIIDELD